MPVPSSTRRGFAVAAFPDVCKTPAPFPPVPIPYPNLASKGTASTHGEPALLRGKLNDLHLLLALPGTDPDLWHALLDEYVLAAAGLYLALASD